MRKKLMSGLLCLTMMIGSISTVWAGAEEEVVLNVVGPIIFNSYDDVTDPETGAVTPGYHVIEERWNELYPNVKINWDICPGDGWTSYVTTAAMDGKCDVMLHGAYCADMAEDLTPYFEADPEYDEQMMVKVYNKRSDNTQETICAGVACDVSPINFYIDTEKFKNFGVEIPDENWTLDDLLSLAEKLTGTDPVTGEMSYGLQLPFAGHPMLAHNMTMTAKAMGGTLINWGTDLASTTFNYDSELGIAAFEYIEKLVPYLNPASSDGTVIGCYTTFDGENDWAIAANSASYQSGYDIKQNGFSGRYLCYTFPVIGTGDLAGIPAPSVADYNLAICKDSTQKDWAWEFIKFYTSDPVCTDWAAQKFMWNNCVDRQEDLKEVLDEQTVETIMRTLKSVPAGWSMASNDCYDDSLLGATQAEIRSCIEEIVQGRMTPEEAAASVQAQAEEFVSMAG